MIKFVVIAQPRCGSYWMASMLDAHPDVLCPIDVFNRYRPSYQMTEWSARAARDALWSDSHDIKHEAVGCVFHPSVSAPGAWSAGILELLAADKNVRVVKLWRKNMLHMALSLREAETSGWWRVLPKDKEAAEKARKPVYLSRDYMLGYFKQWEKERSTVNDLFKDHRQLDVWYDEEKSTGPATANKVQKFIGVKKLVDVSPGYLRQRSGDLVEPRCSNYAEVVRSLTGTKYENWLDSSPAK